MLRKAEYNILEYTEIDWYFIDSNWMNWTATEFIHALSHHYVNNCYSLNKDSLDTCDICVVLLPCDQSSFVEIGCAISKNKPVLIVLDKTKFKPELIHSFIRPQMNVILDID
jgi:nucleoside 2-deoxyribosyltransferase